MNVVVLVMDLIGYHGKFVLLQELIFGDLMEGLFGMKQSTRQCPP